jgi:hypothetical protein
MRVKARWTVDVLYGSERGENQRVIGRLCAEGRDSVDWALLPVLGGELQGQVDEYRSYILASLDSVSFHCIWVSKLLVPGLKIPIGGLSVVL